MELQPTRTHPDDFRAFSQSLEGKVRSRHHAEYAGWYYSAAWNGRDFGRYPEYIVRAASIADVIKTVNFARTHGLQVAIKGSGHSYAGIFFRDGGVLLDLSQLDQLDVVADARMAVAGPGVTAGRLSKTLAAHHLAFPTGHGAEVGISGFLLGGGLGINCDAWGGMSTFNIQAVDVVTADGQLLHADEQQHPELLWAARGGGVCLFFVVVRFYLRCWPMPQAMVLRAYDFAGEAMGPLLAALMAHPWDRRIQLMVALAGGNESTATLSATAFCSSVDEAQELHAGVLGVVGRWIGSPYVEQVLQDFNPIYQQTTASMTGRRYRADNVMTDEVFGSVQALLGAMRASPSPATFSLVILRPHHDYPDAAFSLRGALSISTYAQWKDEEDDEVNRRWLNDLYDALGVLCCGRYINEMDLETRAVSTSSCFSEPAWACLMELARNHDPKGLFGGRNGERR